MSVVTGSAVPPTPATRKRASFTSTPDISCESLVVNIAENDQITSSVRTAIENGLESTLISTLSAYIDRTNLDVENVCNRNFLDFINSVQELLSMKAQVSQLKNHIVQLNEELQRTGSEALDLAETLVKHQKAVDNIGTTSQVLRHHLHLVKLAQTIERLNERGEYYPALKALDKLRGELQKQAYSTKFEKHLHLWIPAMIVRVKRSVTKQLTEWMLEIRTGSYDIGERAMALCAKKYDGDRGGERPDEEEEADAIEAIIHRLSPVYKCLHVYTLLGQQRELSDYYKANRLPQLELQTMLGADLYSMSTDQFVKQHEALFRRFAAFFLVEHVVMKTCDDIITKQEVDSQLAVCSEKLCTLLSQHLNAVSDPENIVKMKETGILCARTLQSGAYGGGFDNQTLPNFFRASTTVMEKAIVRKTEVSFRKLLEKERYEPTRIKTEEEYLKIIAPFGLSQSDPHQRRRSAERLLNFPATFPFSLTVPSTCFLVQEEIVLFTSHCRDLELHNFGSLLSHLLNEILLAIDRVLNELLDNSGDIQISQACQFSINAAALARACPSFSSFVTSAALKYSQARRKAAEGGSAREEQDSASEENQEEDCKTANDLLPGERKLQSTSSKAQDLVFEVVVGKIDSLLSSVCFVEWTPTIPATSPHSYVEDIMSYLQVTFMCLTYLPQPVRESIHFASCGHISSQLMVLIMGPQVPHINMIGLYNFSLDLNALIVFADTCGVPQLRDCFGPLEQLISLILSGRPEEILDDSLRIKKYAKVQPDNVVTLLSKYKDLSTFDKLKAAGKLHENIPHLKKKQVEAVLKQLK